MGQNIENFKNNINKQLNIGVNQAPIYLEEQKTPKILSGTPIRPNVFIGRDNSIDAIQEALVKDGNKMVLLSGKGGIGKTTLAAQYYFKYFNIK